jgi:hypothetical protein
LKIEESYYAIYDHLIEFLRDINDLTDLLRFVLIVNGFCIQSVKDKNDTSAMMFTHIIDLCLAALVKPNAPKPRTIGSILADQLLLEKNNLAEHLENCKKKRLN